MYYLFVLMCVCVGNQTSSRPRLDPSQGPHLGALQGGCSEDSELAHRAAHSQRPGKERLGNDPRRSSGCKIHSFSMQGQINNRKRFMEEFREEEHLKAAIKKPGWIQMIFSST